MNTMCPKCEEEDCYVHNPKSDYYCVACDDCGFQGPEGETAEDAIVKWDNYCYGLRKNIRIILEKKWI